MDALAALLRDEVPLEDTVQTPDRRFSREPGSGQYHTRKGVDGRAYGTPEESLPPWNVSSSMEFGTHTHTHTTLRIRTCRANF